MYRVHENFVVYSNQTEFTYSHKTTSSRHLIKWKAKCWVGDVQADSWLNRKISKIKQCFVLSHFPPHNLLARNVKVVFLRDFKMSYQFYRQKIFHNEQLYRFLIEKVLVRT